jgi:hypothetical protein
MKKLTLTTILFSFVLINACNKEENSKKSFTLEMKVDGVLWTAAKNQAGLFTPSTGKLSFTGQKGDELVSLNKDSVALNGTYAMPSGSITVLYTKGGSLISYSLSSSKPKTKGSVTLKSLNESGVTNVQYPEADFSGVLYDIFNADSIVITEGKLRYQ